MGLFDRLRGTDSPRVAFFGIDGVPFRLVADNPDVFPTLSAIAEDGSAGAIDSIVPPESSACWPSLTTGVNPGETGVYGFQDREIDSYDTYVPMGRDVQATRLWDRVEAVEGEDRHATVLNVPVTFPPQRNVQRMVSGFLSPGVEAAAYPDELRETLEGLDYRIDVDAKLGHDDDKTEFVEDAHRTLEARYEAFRHYVEADDWDLFFGVFMTTDRVNHFLFEDYERDGEYREEFLEFYRQVDASLGELREALADDVTMVVASDHGFTTLEYEVHCNEWLEREGWLAFEDRYDVSLNRWLATEGWLERAREGADDVEDLDPATRAYSPEPGSVVVNTADAEAPGAVDDPEAVRVELAAALEGLETADGTSLVADVETREADVHAADLELVGPAEPKVVFKADVDEGDWLEHGHRELDDIAEETRAYSLIPGRFYLNLEGREPRGSVPESEYEAVRDELQTALESLAGPDGRRVAERVVTTEAAFRGDHDEIAPDLVVIPNDGFDLKAGFSGSEAVFEAGPRNGMHTFENASLFVDDPDVRLGDADLYDIAPTLLDLMEVDYERSDFDGGSRLT
jgi:predicted AlkP superfamily phosphohydrolase/phosphomutase